MTRAGVAVAIARWTLALSLVGGSLPVRLAFAQPAERAHNHSHHGTADTSSERAPPVARELWSDLYCMCGECEHVTLAECACENAAKERKRIADEVEKIGLGSPERDENARATVLSAYIVRHGANAEVRYAKLHRWLDPLLMLVAVVGGSLGMFILVERLLAARKAAAAPASKGRKFRPTTKRRDKKRR